MSALSKVLAAKIVITLMLWSIPLIFYPVSLLQWLGFVVPEPQLFLRLLGMAYAALVVGYVFGFRDSRQGIYPTGIVWVGIVSNGGAFLMLAIAAIFGVWESWGVLARLFMWVSLAGTGSITVGLVAFGPCGSRTGAKASQGCRN